MKNKIDTKLRRQLDKQIADIKDRTRWLIASPFGSRMLLIYRIEDDTSLMYRVRRKHPLESKDVTLIKRKLIAQDLLRSMKKRRKWNKDLQLFECKVSSDGKTIKLAAQGRKTGT